MQASIYPDSPVRPELVRNAQLLTVFLEVDQAVVRALLPEGLAPRPDSRIILNMWSHQSSDEITGFGGFGPMSVSYLAVEVAGQEGSSADGSVRFPGRLWVHHWCSFDRVRDYASAASGLRICPGMTNVQIKGGRFFAQLTVGGRVAITASAQIGNERLRTMSGHSIYYAERLSANGRAEVAQFEVPWVSDVFNAELGAAEFSFEEGAPEWQLIGHRHPTVLGVAYRRITLVPYLAQRTIGNS
jgi:hypothetical protein